MKAYIIFTLMLICSSSFSQVRINIDSFCRANESLTRINNSFNQFYILNSKDTTYYTEHACVHRCQLSTPTICRMYIKGNLANGYVIDVNNDSNFTHFSYGEYYEGIMFRGEIKELYKDGKLKLIGTIKNGLPFGIWKEYYETGKLKSRRKYIKNSEVAIKRVEYDENGKKIDSF